LAIGATPASTEVEDENDDEDDDDSGGTNTGAKHIPGFTLGEPK